MEKLEIGRDYEEIFGLAKGKQTMTYNGGISWTAAEGDKSMKMDYKETTDNALKYLNQGTSTGLR